MKENDCRIAVKQPDSLAAVFEDLFCGIGESRFVRVWRGQANVELSPIPGLYRRLIRNGYNECEIDEKLICDYEMDLFCEANGLGFYGEGGGNRLDFMVNLQHFGGATRLLDVTLDPFIGLWYSVNRCDKNDGVIYMYDIDVACRASSETVFSWDDLTNPAIAGKPVLYIPGKINERIKSQSSCFLTTTLDETLDHGSIFTRPSLYAKIVKIVINSKLKSPIFNYLVQSRGIREFDVYPDIVGYAMSNNQLAPFPREVNDLYDGATGMYPPSFRIRDGG